MSTFYLLPPRALLAGRVADQVSRYLPGLPKADVDWADLTERLITGAVERADVFVVYREELPLDEEPGRALADGYGAVAGDEVVEIRLGLESASIQTRQWRISNAA